MNIDNITSDGIALSNNGKEMLIKVYEQEIERLKEEYMILQNASDEVEEELQQRIDKAIEIMYDKGTFNLDTECGKVFVELLNILRGEYNE